ncbi:MAG: ABC transporter permease [Chloroflexi bacterium]|nr:ABC transporter permease [Chloroflexota bacterium]
MLIPLVVANLKMTIRNRQALFWALAFPLIFVAIFGLFDMDKPPTTTIHIVDYAQDDLSRGLVQNLSQIQTFKVAEKWDETQARKKLKNGDIRYLLVIPKGLANTMADGSPAGLSFVFDERSPTASTVIGMIDRFLGQMNLELAKAPTLLELQPQGILSRKMGYFDFLLPGLVGMGVMTYSIIGLASAIALYREQKILKRILATPLRVRNFFAAQILSYLVISLAQAAIIMAAGMTFFGAKVYGNYLYLVLLVLLGNVIFLNLGFIVGSIAKNVNAANGLGNAVSMPMMFLSGVFFPKEGLPRILAIIVQYLPLSPMLDAIRGVALESKSLLDYPTELGILAAWIVVTSVIAVRVFRFG